MKIALLGYGKMGKVIETIALDRGHEIVLRKTSSTTFAGLATADVAIDFSIPSVAVENITTCLEAGVPVVSGTPVGSTTTTLWLLCVTNTTVPFCMDQISVWGSICFLS